MSNHLLGNFFVFMSNVAISIVVPTWNEGENIRPLVMRIDAALRKNKISYEIIFIDDNSTDNTTSVISSLKASYPITHFVKKGVKGKAQSLLEGFSYAKSDIVCMLDADLQYPPEALPGMLAKIKKGG